MWTAAGLAVGLAPIAFLAIAFAAGVLDPNSDASRGVLGMESGVMLVALGAGAAALSRRLLMLRSHLPWLDARGKCVAVLVGAFVTALPLMRSTSGGSFQWALTCLGAAGVYLLLLAAAAWRAALATRVALALALALAGPAVLLDLAPVDLHGPAPIPSPR